MKFIVSSKGLFRILSQIDFESDRVESIICVNNEVLELLTAKGDTVKIFATNKNTEGEKSIPQDYRRWDWVYNLVKKIDDQPIVIEVSQNLLNILIQY